MVSSNYPTPANVDILNQAYTTIAQLQEAQEKEIAEQSNNPDVTITDLFSMQMGMMRLDSFKQFTGLKVVAKKPSPSKVEKPS